MRTSWRPATHSQPTLGASMTPMIDVVFLLLIFFVCTASFQPVEALLPGDLLISGAGSIDAPPEEQPQLERVVIHAKLVGDAVAWRVNEADCPTDQRLRDLLAQLAGIDSSLPVVIDPDRRVQLGRVIDGFDAARSAGFTDVKFAASVD
ncbi:Biopolymer transport protein ExbD/TolR [Posidoniimonas corsicana]|uniref:Biopolymer transport protein ExbD/TolR n=1 Tax=Posidoniimonas corsicana TaxID=1938618 RepID=A0A5C5VIE3_9BACT|nr:biopolymer transporter ExbD [Posidoniimonas corsicana]TWT37881.1 Biopolymer transport protein ExbD/TolR [Posidoniimonas corsicana]